MNRHPLLLCWPHTTAKSFSVSNLIAFMGKLVSPLIVYCRDDGSTDGTLEILSEYERTHNLKIVRDDLVGGSAAKNFRHLALCVDHDEANISSLATRMMFGWKTKCLQQFSSLRQEIVSTPQP